MSQQENQNPSDDVYARARRIYEGTSGMTMTALAEMTGIDRETLARVKKSQGWRKQQATKYGGVSEDAIQSAQALKDAAAREAEMSPPQVTDEQVQSLASQVMPDHTGEILDRHLKELAVVRALVVEAVKFRDTNGIKAFDRARLARQVAETLRLVHDGERRAMGIGANDKANNVPPTPAGYVLVDRSGDADD